MAFEIHESRSGPVWILEREVFNDAGEMVRRLVVSDRLAQISTDLNRVARFFLDNAGVCFGDELTIYLQVDFSVGIPLCLEGDRTGDRVR